MRVILGVLMALAAVSLAAPSASACKLDQGTSLYKDICTWSTDAKLDLLFQDWSDIGLIVLALFAIPLLFTVLVWLFRKPAEGPKVSVTPREGLKEVQLGGTVQLILDVENQREATSTDVAVDVGNLPPGWSAVAFAAVAYPSGFTAPQALSSETPLHLSGSERGAHKAALAIQLTAPGEAYHDETFTIPVRVVPVVAGVRRTGRAKTAKFTVALSTHRALVQIANVVHDPVQIAAGQPVLTKATLANQGDTEAREVGVGFFLNDQSIDRKVVPTIPPQQQATIEFQWIPGPGENRIRITVV